MKLKEEFLLVKIDESNIVVPTGGAVVDFNAMITLNDTGVFLWEQLKTPKENAELVQVMCLEYDVDEHTAAGDIHEFVEMLQSAGLLES